MTTRGWLIVIIVLALVILALGVFLIFAPAPKTPEHGSAAETSGAPIASTTTPEASTTEPLSYRVSVSSPAPGGAVSHTFTVSGHAPGNWSFEAQFPIMVRDESDNVIGRATGHMQGDWTTERLVPFTASVQIDSSYHGKATLILLKDNPSGLPQNDDSVEVPIVVD